MSDYTYRLSFVFAVALHVVLALFLLVKFSTSRPTALSPTNTFVNAVAINEYDIVNLTAKTPETIKPTPTMPQQATQLSPPKPQVKDLMKDVLQKNLLMEQAKEMAELKKEKRVYQKNIAKKQQQQKMQMVLQEQIKAEQKQLVEDQTQVSATGGSGGQSQGEIDKYKAMVIQAISSQWGYSGDADEKATGQLLINITPTGEVLNVQLSSSSGNLALDRSAQAAVFKASPLPVPGDPSLFDALIKMTFTRHGFV